jgi:hypothetical protein
MGFGEEFTAEARENTEGAQRLDNYSSKPNLIEMRTHA